jgi:hypothetical protein
MDFCEQNDIDFVFGLSGNGTLDHAVEIVADDIRTRRALAQAPVLRGCYAETMYRAKSWSKSRRACARIEATSPGLDIRYVVTSLAAGSAEHIYAHMKKGKTKAPQRRTELDKIVMQLRAILRRETSDAVLAAATVST